MAFRKFIILTLIVFGCMPPLHGMLRSIYKRALFLKSYHQNSYKTKSNWSKEDIKTDSPEMYMIYGELLKQYKHNPISVLVHLIDKKELKMARIFMPLIKDINEVHHLGTTALISSVYLQNRDAIELLFQREDLDVNRRDNYGFSPLSFAFTREYTDENIAIMQMLRSRGAQL